MFKKNYHQNAYIFKSQLTFFCSNNFFIHNYFACLRRYCWSCSANNNVCSGIIYRFPDWRILRQCWWDNRWLSLTPAADVPFVQPHQCGHQGNHKHCDTSKCSQNNPSLLVPFVAAFVFREVVVVEIAGSFVVTRKWFLIVMEVKQLHFNNIE